ncbi:MAG: cyclopropane-fatty-acyl-phospholipid synthase family protein [Pseudomonadota bacterium]
MSLITVTPETLKTATEGLPIGLKTAISFATRIRVGSIQAILPDGREILIKGDVAGPEARITIHSPAFATRTMKRGVIGVAESYLAGDWSSDTLTEFLEVFCRNASLIQSLANDRPLLQFWLNISHWFNRNTKRGSKRNIYAHYDLGNRFYSKWLDPSMTYSSAIYDHPEEDLSNAQRRKYESLAKQIALTPDDDVLEVGCGWGGFAEFAASQVGAKVTGITISKEQFDFAQKRIFEAGLNEKVEIRLEDYRDTQGQFDKIASIEMFEAVGEKYWPTYFKMLRDRMKPGGKAGIQVITIQDEMFPHYKRRPDFIQKYVFPGGMLPSPSALRNVASKSGLALSDEKIFGLDYARTLAEWRDRFFAAWPEIKPLGFDDRFKRLWEFYLAYCEAGFKAGNIDVRQVVYSHAS